MASATSLGTEIQLRSVENQEVSVPPSIQGDVSRVSSVGSSQDQTRENVEEVLPDYPTGFKFAGTMAAVCLYVVVVGLDTTIVATAVPSITRHFGTISDIGWYTSVFRLSSGSFQFMFGKLYSLFPAKPIILISLAILTVGNLLCALASSSYMFIVGRAVTGLATSGVISGAFATFIQTLPLQKRSTYSGMAAATEEIASLTAPLIGGLLTDRLTWRWCFFIELPLTVTAFVIVVFFFDTARRNHRGPSTFREKLRSLDLLGTAIFIPCLTSLLLALQWGGSRYGWSDWRVVTATGLFAILAVSFAFLQWHLQERATLPPRIILQRSVLFGFCFSCCNNAAISIVQYYMPIYFQTVRGYSPAKSGVMVLPSAVGLIVSFFVSGMLTSKLGYSNPFMITTSMTMPPSTGLISTLNIDAKLWSLIFYQALLGFGAGIGFQGPQVAVQAIFPDKDSQIGIAIIQFAQAIGPAISSAAAQNIFSSKLTSNLRRFAPHIDPATVMSGGLTAPNVKAGDGGGQSGIVLSYDNALTQTFYLSVSLACVSLIGALGVEWRSVKKKRQ